jgi:response regulator RpfG family c-di-GMP phosphodiesterase/DNA-binding CsgD family transcriptional regulator
MRETTILVVDDLPEHIRVFTDILLHEDPNVNLLAASNGKNAYELAKAKLPHLIIMDWDMPVMNGLEATLALKSDQLTKNIPIIIASGMHTGAESLKEAMNSGAVDFIRKPVDRVELIARVRSMLRLVDSYLDLMHQKELNLQQEIKFKLNELNTQALNIAQQNDFLLYMLNELKELLKISNSQSKKQIFNIIEHTNQQIKGNSWENFEQQFRIAYDDFYRLFLQKFPKLTPNDRKLGYLLRMGLTSKEIAAITFQEPSSVDVARYRLRQKLGLDKDANLSHFLMNIQ